MRRFVKFVFLALVLAGAWIAFLVWTPLTPGETKFVLLRPKWGARRIARELKSAGVIRSERAFLLVHLARGARTLKAGEYKFEGPETPIVIRDRLVHGDIYARNVTIPEGYNIFDVSRAVEQAGLASSAEVLQAAQTELDLVKDIDPEAKSLEGYLYPDTYQFTRTMSVHDMLGAMVRRFRQEAHSLNLTANVHQIVTMASIVEKETSVPEERPEVASVYYNRLGRRMALAADPSVIYAALLAGHYRGTIYASDLQFDSPYNTYRFAGLPPGPIACPGRSSLAAAMSPARTQYLYFVADGNGGHRFAKTLEEHNRNVLAYRKALLIR